MELQTLTSKSRQWAPRTHRQDFQSLREFVGKGVLIRIIGSINYILNKIPLTNREHVMLLHMYKDLNSLNLDYDMSTRILKAERFDIN